MKRLTQGHSPKKDREEKEETRPVTVCATSYKSFIYLLNIPYFPFLFRQFNFLLFQSRVREIRITKDILKKLFCT